MTVDTKAGTTYRGYCVETEDNMNVKLRNVLATGPTGEERPLDHVFIRGSQVNFVIFPDILKHSPMFERVLQRKQGRVVERGLGRARSAAIASKGTCNRASVHCRRFYRPKLAGAAVLCPPRQPLQPPQQQANTARSRRPSTPPPRTAARRDQGSFGGGPPRGAMPSFTPMYNAGGAGRGPAPPRPVYGSAASAAPRASAPPPSYGAGAPAGAGGGSAPPPTYAPAGSAAPRPVPSGAPHMGGPPVSSGMAGVARPTGAAPVAGRGRGRGATVPHWAK